MKPSLTSQDLTVMWKLRCLESQLFVGLRASACGFLTSQLPLKADPLKVCWSVGWMAPSAGCRSQCRT